MGGTLTLVADFQKAAGGPEESKALISDRVSIGGGNVIHEPASQNRVQPVNGVGKIDFVSYTDILKKNHRRPGAVINVPVQIPFLLDHL